MSSFEVSKEWSVIQGKLSNIIISVQLVGLNWSSVLKEKVVKR